MIKRHVTTEWIIQQVQSGKAYRFYLTADWIQVREKKKEKEHRQKELENEDLINNESSLKNNNQEYNKAQEELKSHEIKVNRLDVKIDNLLNILTNDYSISYEKAKEKRTEQEVMFSSLSACSVSVIKAASCHYRSRIFQ